MTEVPIAVTDLFCLYSVPGGATVAALRGLSLRVEPGERLVVHGPNGSGKTTLLRVLTGEVAAGSGSVRVAGRELVNAGPARLTALRRDVLGVVDQHSGRTLRPELSVLDNVALQLRLASTARVPARTAALAALGSLGLEGFADRRPSTLSAGEAQRVAVCAAVAHRPAVLLADEPTGELDVAAADTVYDLLQSAAAGVGAALLLVTHDPRAARIADRVVRMRDGRLSEQWRPSAVDGSVVEQLVVDDRGWLRLPETLRQRAGVRDTASIHFRADRLELRGSAPTADPVAVRVPVPAPLGTSDSGHRPVVRLSDLQVRYGERVVLAGFSADVVPGSLTVVRGRSGAGKSTVLRLLLGLADPDVGEVELAGQVLQGMSRAARAGLRREVVGVSTQAGALAEALDVAENLALARAARRLAADPAAIDEVVDALGLDAVRRRPVRLLSGGERQRVAVARSLVVQRRLVVLDEPTSQQDEANAREVAAVLVAAARAGTAVVCATHDEILAGVADEVLNLA